MKQVFLSAPHRLVVLSRFFHSGIVKEVEVCNGSDRMVFVPVIHAKWIDGACSNCGEKSFSVHKNYCSFCGARLDGE